MSKKTKRLEKENMTLTRKHDITNKNIFDMAEERDRMNREVQALKKNEEKLKAIINQMQKQGRGLPQGEGGMLDGNASGDYAEGEGDPEGTESEFEYEDEEEEGSEEGEYDEDTEEEVLEPQPFGPVPPPPAGKPMTNGTGKH